MYVSKQSNTLRKSKPLSNTITRSIAAVGLIAGAIALTPLQAETRLSIGKRTGESGQSLSTPIEVASDDGLVGFQMDIDFDSNDVDVTGVTGASLSTDHTIRSESISDGKRRLLVYSPTNAELEDGVIGDAELDLTNNYANGEIAFTFSQLRFVNQSGVALNLSLAPFVRLESPSASSSFDELAEVVLSSVAFETAGDITRVEFLVDGRIIATDTSAPYSASWQADTVGNTILSAVAYDEDGDSAPSPDTLISIQAADILQDWRDEHFTPTEQTNGQISGLVADPDGDRIMNFLEYAFGLDPRSPDLSGLPSTSIEQEGEQEFLSLIFSKPENLDTLDYIVEFSDDLVNWVSADESVTQESLGVENGKERFQGKLVSPIDSASAGKQFIRVRVQFK